MSPVIKATFNLCGQDRPQRRFSACRETAVGRDGLTDFLVGDQVGCRLENGQVFTPPGFKEAWRKLYEAGWKAMNMDSEFGGQDAPMTVQLMVEKHVKVMPTLAVFDTIARLAAHEYGLSDMQRRRDQHVSAAVGKPVQERERHFLKNSVSGFLGWIRDKK